MSPKITIITISYNNREGLKKTIKSVDSQSHVDFEYIVIDGGSQDGSKEILEQFANKISYWVSEPDKGIYNAMNKGIKAANGEYLLFLNSGDEFFANDVLEKASSQLGNEDVIYGNLEFIDENQSYNREYPKTISFHYLYTDALPHPASFIKKTAFDKVGLYDENLKIVSDWKWFIEAFSRFHLTWKHIPITVSKFYLDGISSKQIEKVNAERDLALSNFTLSEKKDAETIENLQKIVKNLQATERNYIHLKNYKSVRILAKLRLIQIR